MATAKPKPEVRLLREPEVAKFIGVSTSTVRRLVNRGEFPKPVKIGGKLIAWRSAEVQRWIDRLPAEA